MPSPVTLLSEYIVEELNTESFATRFQCARRYLPVKQLEELTPLLVSVFPRTIEKDLANRSQVENTIGVNVGFQKRVKNTNPETLDPLIDLVDEVASHLTGLQFGSNFHWQATELTPYNEKLLDETSEFRSVIQLTYLLDEDR